MKQNIMISKFIFVFVVILIQSCGKEDSTVQKIPGDEQTNPVSDLVAFMDPIQKKLFVIPEHKNKVLEKLGAEPLQEGSYTMKSLTVNAKSITSTFTISAVNTPAEILLYINEADKWFDDYQADKDTARGVLIKTFKDSTGTFYRVYKNAECVKVRNESVTPCNKEVKFYMVPVTIADSLVYRWEARETGKYTKTEYLDEYHCNKGGSYCVEALVVTSRTNIYNDVNCSQILEIFPGYNYSCIK